MIEPCHGMRHNSVPAGLSIQMCASVVAPVGLPATMRCEPRQARKGAAAAANSGAGVRWAGVAFPFWYSEHSVSTKMIFSTSYYESGDSR